MGKLQSFIQNMNMTEKLCLQWNDFKVNVSSSFRELREDKDLTDVTLVCEDGSQVEAHKVILAASSPFFMNILKRNKHPHPLIYMRGLKSEDLVAIVDFLYLGAANVFQESLDSFLAIAEELKLKGLTGTGSSAEAQEPTLKAEPTHRKGQPQIEKVQRGKTPFNDGYQMPSNPDTVVSVQENQISVGLQDLNEQIRSMMTMTDVRSADGKGYMASCNICGKQAPSRNMPTHIEGNHITGVTHACDLCGKVSRSREAIRQHKKKNHKILLQDKTWSSQTQV